MPTTSTISAAHYNSIQTRVADVLGLGENGWGKPNIDSGPVTNRTRVTADQWNSLLDDVNQISLHILNISTTTQTVTAATELISLVPGQQLDHITQVLIQEPTRYTCHPEQYVLDPTTSTVRPALFVTSSTRTTSWGLSPITINHGLTVSFITRLHAYYYFNLGNYLVWKPFYLPADVSTNDLDQEWQQWIDYIRNSPELEFRYTRTNFVNTLSNQVTQVYTSGTLSITVIANRRFDERNIDFSITYANETTTLLVVSPTVAGYTINI